MLKFVVPGPIQTLTGGFIYDRRMAEALGFSVIELKEPAPNPGEEKVLNNLTGAVLIDGLSLAHVRVESLVARPFALVHHPVSLEDGQTVTAKESQLFRQMEGIITTSHHTAAVLRNFGVNPDRVRTVQPATDPVPLGPAVRAEGPVRLLCIASVTPRKGHDRLLSAFERLGDGFELELIGSADHTPEWSKEILGHARRLRVTHRPRVSEADRIAALHRADLFVFASAYEGFGMAPVEAIRAGVPVVSTRAGALVEALPDGPTVWVEPEPEAIAAGIVEAAAKLPHLTHSARSVAPGLRDWPTAATEFSKSLRELGAIP
ncbi:MAG: glycosyltransferase family 4 protein [Myxococcota bacterium]